MVRLFTTFVTIICMASLAAGSPPNISDFDWSVIQPSDSLNYTKCYETFKCARLNVPLDRLDEDDPARVTIAIVALPAAVPEDDPTFGGTVFTNPGGPGASGVGFVLREGTQLQDGVSSEDKKFEILSFDPRGVGLTVPRADCWQDERARQAFELEELTMGSPAEGGRIVGRGFARSIAFGKLCERSACGDPNDIRNFISTSSVARDMLEIVDKIGELRNGREVDYASDAGDEQLELRAAKDVPRLNYLGYSYGTVLGNYFASMFPGRVGYVALEAVVDIHDYHNGTWIRNLQDMPHVYEHLWETCHAAGDKCALYRFNDKDPQDTRSRFEAWVQGLEESPAAVASESSIRAITPWEVALAIFGPLYNPMKLFPRTAEILAGAMAGNFSSLLNGSVIPPFDYSCPLKSPTSYTWNMDAQTAIACGDALPQTNLTITEFKDYIDILEDQDPIGGPFWSHIRKGCIGWNYRPKYAFSGPWTTPEHDPNSAPDKPLAPLLFISSRYDPVTPLQGAREMAKYHPGSGVLIQNSVGHGADIVPGKCRDEAIRRFFATGEVPDGELVCEPDCVPFQECEGYSPGVLRDHEEPDQLRKQSPLEMMW